MAEHTITLSQGELASPTSSEDQSTNSRQCLSFSVYGGLADFRTGYPVRSFGHDEAGVIICKTGNPARKYHYSLISRWGLSALVEYERSGASNALNTARAQADYLMSSLHSTTTLATLKFPFIGAGTPPGWTSGIANGAAADLLLHLGHILGRRTYELAAVRLVRTFLVSVEDGGLAAAMPKGGIFFEEYAADNAVVRHILNGHIIAMMHLDAFIRNYSAIGGDSATIANLQTSFDNGALAFRQHMDDFDATSDLYGPTTYYDLSVRQIKPPNSYPHRIHCRGAEWLGRIYDDAAFKAKATQWNTIYIDAQKASKAKSPTNRLSIEFNRCLNILRSRFHQKKNKHNQKKPMQQTAASAELNIKILI